MSDRVAFFDAPPPLTLGEILSITGASVAPGIDLDATIVATSPLDRAGPDDLTFLDNGRYIDQAASTRAKACLIGERLAARLPATTVALIARDPYRAFALVSGAMYPKALRPPSIFGSAGISPGSSVHPAARLENDVTVDPGVVIGAGAEIGSGTVIAANAVVGPNVRIGRNCYIGPAVTLVHALVGNHVLIHGGASIGHDGFGFAMGASGHLKLPQIGRVVIQDHVEIGANSCIDRGSNRDTVIGEGTKIDNLVQIGHNVSVGRHCVIAAMVGISGSTIVEDFVVLGGQVGITGHVRIGTGAQIAGSAAIIGDIPAGTRWGGVPARPLKQWFREVAILKKLGKRGKPAGNDEPAGSS